MRAGTLMQDGGPRHDRCQHTTACSLKRVRLQKASQDIRKGRAKQRTRPEVPLFSTFLVSMFGFKRCSGCNTVAIRKMIHDRFGEEKASLHHVHRRKLYEELVRTKSRRTAERLPLSVSPAYQLVTSFIDPSFRAQPSQLCLVIATLTDEDNP